MNRKPDPAVFLRAAELIESDTHRYACVALQDALQLDPQYLHETPEYILFRDLYKPWYYGEVGPWWFFTPWSRWSRARALRRCAKIAAQLP